MRKNLLIGVLVLFVTLARGAENPKWLRYPAISPDGKTIVFSYKGDLYKVAATGGDATPLTLHEAHDFMPVWSRDGKYIAFASDRYGNFDVFIMPASGGEAKRLTYHSANDFPYDFTPDGKAVLFGTTRNDIYTSVRFPQRGLFLKLYTVPVSGGRSVLYLSAGSEYARFNTKGDQLIFQDRKGYEDAWRKHHTSSVTRDIWIYDVKTQQYTKTSTFEGEDREPLFSADDKFVYYLSEKAGGSQNIFKAPVNAKSGEVQLTKFTNHPVRFLSRANDNTLCFTYDGEIYTLKEGSAPQKVNIRILTDSRSNEKIIPVNKDVTQTALSPNGKEIAFVVRGEIFVTAVEGGITRRITNTPEQERMVQFSPDGRSLIYATERGNSWDIYRASIVREEEPYFYASTLIKEEPLIATEADEFQPQISPDGKEIAYLEERNILKVYNIQTKKSRTLVPAGVNYSYADGDQEFRWSHDGKWIALRSNEGLWPKSEVALVSASGSGNRINLTESGFYDGYAKWGFNGKALLWVTDRDGKQPLAVQGAREIDIYIMFFDQELYDRFKLSKEDYELLKEKEANEKKEKKDSKDSALAEAAKKDKDWRPLFENLDSRKLRLTIHSGNIADYHLSENGEKLYYLARGEKGFDLWQTDTRTRATSVLARLDGGPGEMEISKDGKNIFVVSGGRIVKVEVAGGKISPVRVDGEMTLNEAAERKYIFDHAWRQVKKKFFDPTLQGVDWAMYRKAYEKFLPHVNNNYDFQELLSEMLGELNASHTGCRYSRPQENTDATASLGLLYDETYTGAGLKVMEVIEGGPLLNAKTKINKGVIIEKIDGEPISPEIDWNRLLNRKTNKNVLLHCYNPATRERWEEVIKPISQQEEQSLLYKRWVKTMRKIVNELSGGKVGYVHVQSMSDGSFRSVFEEVLGKNINKEALIVDTRFNGGGWLHDDLVTFLSGRRYLNFSPQGVNPIPGEPNNRWSKPSCVVMSESNYSDAFIFPYAYKALGIGKLIGMPVPGTGTCVWWEQQIDPTLVFGIPMIATIGKENRPTENLQLEPDIRVENEYNAILNGKDQQLERAVKEMLEAIKNKDPRKGF
jgi:Periplasmic protease